MTAARCDNHPHCDGKARDPFHSRYHEVDFWLCDECGLRFLEWFGGRDNITTAKGARR